MFHNDDFYFYHKHLPNDKHKTFFGNKHLPKDKNKANLKMLI